ncbi:hypothetical protein [Streptomyces sp. NPDC001970]
MSTEAPRSSRITDALLPPGPPAEPPVTPAETTTRLRPITDSTPPPSPRAAAGAAGAASGAVPPRPSGPPPGSRPGAAVPAQGNASTGPGGQGGVGSRPYAEHARPAAPARMPRSGAAVPPQPSRPPWTPPVLPYASALPETPTEITTRLRPIRTRHPARSAAAVACLVLGLGLVGGAVTGSWLAGDPSTSPTATGGYTEARTLWHSVPVDSLFPRTLNGPGAGPGRADRSWTRIAVAPDGPCAGALDPLLVKVVQPVGCLRVLRATYTDATATSVTTVGMIFTEADQDAMAALRTRFSREGLDERADLMPRTYAAPGTAAAGFGDKQRASWTVSVLRDAPVIVYAVSGFADGRTVADPQPAGEAMVTGATSAPAQAGLGHEAKGIADRIERALRKIAAPATERPE